MKRSSSKNETYKEAKRARQIKTQNKKTDRQTDRQNNRENDSTQNDFSKRRIEKSTVRTTSATEGSRTAL